MSDITSWIRPIDSDRLLSDCVRTSDALHWIRNNAGCKLLAVPDWRHPDITNCNEPVRVCLIYPTNEGSKSCMNHDLKDGHYYQSDWRPEEDTLIKRYESKEDRVD
ncbi:hypothetical protein WOLCODRAFT_166989 [Wolfiporia cocos MD-104 SS10]|uniref:Uncharacterized protein n=1 Tax=Wolfiporia cocos (strain MD-104) TaxID=742152 RepID=A0A2H3J3K8_WOLCO|nr:hypothetical protein WOLCODRAFT_166989 [Wolfiporia cocos MD-104 SS10]